MEAAAEVGGVGEGGELPQQAGIRPTLHGEQPVAADCGEPWPLAKESQWPAAEGHGGLGHSGEIDVGSDVGGSGIQQRVIRGTVTAKCSQRPLVASRVVVLRPSEANPASSGAKNPR